MWDPNLKYESLSISMNPLRYTLPCLLSHSQPPVLFPRTLYHSAPLITLMISQDANQPVDPDTISTIKKVVKKRNHQRRDDQAQIVYDQLTPELKRCMDLSKEKDSSS